MARKPTPQEKAFALGVLAGARRGRQVEQEVAIRDVAAGLLAEDVTEAVGLFERYGNRALSYIANAAKTLWVDRWKRTLGPYILRVMRGAELTTDRGPVTLGFDVKSPENGEFFDNYMLRLSTEVTDTTRERLEGVIRKAVDEGLGIPETARRISEVGDEFQGYRSVLIARTELLNASRGVAHIAAKNSSVVSGKKWVTAGDNRVRDEHKVLNGVEVALGEDFPNGEGQYPTRPMCRCTLIYSIKPDLLEKSA